MNIIKIQNGYLNLDSIVCIYNKNNKYYIVYKCGKKSKITKEDYDFIISEFNKISNFLNKEQLIDKIKNKADSKL